MNLPNKLSIIRILLVPLMVFAYMSTFIPYGKAVAFVLFVIAALTDLFDGRIARKRGLVTDLGKLLDPIADKVLALSVLLLLVVDQTIPAPFGVIATILILSRDFMVDMLRQVGATKNIIIAADKWGKIKTIFLDIAFPMLLLLAFLEQDLLFEGGAVYILKMVGLGIFAIGTILCVFSGINYMVKNAKVFKTNIDTETSDIESNTELGEE